MTKKQFKYEMQRGLGSCVIELKQGADLKRYQDIIIWGCKRELAYDTQCEGTRSYYLYEMIQLYRDWEPFYQVVSYRIDKCLSKYGWEFSQHAELLALMAKGGYEPAIGKLEAVYNCLLQSIMQYKRQLRNERENLEAVCLAFMTYRYDNIKLLEKKYIEIVNDLGRLFATNPQQYFFWHFEWFQSHSEDVLGQQKTENLLKKYSRLEGVNCYVKSRTQYLNKQQENSENSGKNKAFYSAKNLYQMIKDGVKIGKGLPRLTPFYMQNPKRREEVEKLSKIYSVEKEESIRAELLKLLGRRFLPSSDNIEKLIADSKSVNEALSEAAFSVLCYIRDEKVHEYALELITENKVKYNSYIMLIRNYQKEEKDMIVELVKSVPITKESYWHCVFSAVQDLFKDKEIKKPPKELLYYIYRNTLCSTCREYVVREMGKRRMLTTRLLTECCFDSNVDIREYARRKLEKSCEKEKN